MRSLRKVSSTSPPGKLRARTFNAIVDGLQAERRSMRQGPPIGQAATAAGLITIRNGTGADLLPHQVVGLGDPLIHPTTGAASEPGWLSRPGLVGETPAIADHLGRFAITATPIPDGGLGFARVDGAVHCKVQMEDDGHQWADVDDGEVAHLVSGSAGTARILWVDTGDNPRHALVLLGTNAPLGLFANYQAYFADDTLSVPASRMRAVLVGGGGGGGGGSNSSTSFEFYVAGSSGGDTTVRLAEGLAGGGGGGAGGLAFVDLDGLVIGDTITITVGAAGAAGAMATKGATGGHSSIVIAGDAAVEKIVARGGYPGLSGGSNNPGGGGVGGQCGVGSSAEDAFISSANAVYGARTGDRYNVLAVGGVGGASGQWGRINDHVDDGIGGRGGDGQFAPFVVAEGSLAKGSGGAGGKGGSAGVAGQKGAVALLW